ncbi:MAG: Maf family protein [Desulfovibrionaceae bacterium]|nr:Maf family protein [Desulfovibrionaceae bacterium]
MSLDMSFFHALRPLILASGSPRRRDLLRSAGLEFRIRAAPLEVTPETGEDPGHYASRAARGKAWAVLDLLAGEERQAAILAADTIVALDGRILGKPASRAEALEMLSALAGRTHTVITACALLPSGEKDGLVEFMAGSQVTFWNPPPGALHNYAAGDEPLDKAGAYAAQGSGSMLIRSLSGSWTNVVGLPLSETLDALLAHKVIADIAPCYPQDFRRDG